MKILYISHLHPPENQPLENIGGMQNVSMQIVDALTQINEVELKTIILRESWERIELKTTLFLFKLLREIPKAVKEFKPDVILFSSMVTAGVVPFLGNKHDTLKVTINHGQDVTLPVSLYQWYLPYVFKNLDAVISVSGATREACKARGMAPEKGVVLPNGIDKLNFRPEVDRAEALTALEEELGLDLGDGHLLLTVGRLVKRKGHTGFIKNSLPLLKSDVEYLIIGDGPEYDNIQSAAEESASGGRVHLVGRQSEAVLKLAYAAADLFIMPNIIVDGDMEGFGIVLLEANQAGVPVIASDLEGIKDVVEQGINGYRVPFDDPQFFAETIDRVLNTELEKLSASAGNYVEKNFSWDAVAPRYISYLKRIIAEKQGFKQGH